MRRRGFTLIELLIVIVVISLLAALLLPAIVKAICAAKETKAGNLIHNVDGACDLYDRDYNVYPPMDTTAYDTGPCVYTLSQAGPKKQPYMEFVQDDVTQWPVTTGSHLRNPVDPMQKRIKYIDNTRKIPTAQTPTGIHNQFRIDLWAMNCELEETGINNWRSNK